MLIPSAPESKLPCNMNSALKSTTFLPNINLRFLTQIPPPKKKIQAFFLARILHIDNNYCCSNNNMARKLHNFL